MVFQTILIIATFGWHFFIVCFLVLLNSYVLLFIVLRLLLFSFCTLNKKARVFSHYV